MIMRQPIRCDPAAFFCFQLTGLSRIFCFGITRRSGSAGLLLKMPAPKFNSRFARGNRADFFLPKVYKNKTQMSIILWRILKRDEADLFRSHA